MKFNITVEYDPTRDLEDEIENRVVQALVHRITNNNNWKEREDRIVEKMINEIFDRTRSNFYDLVETKVLEKIERTNYNKKIEQVVDKKLNDQAIDKVINKIYMKADIDIEKIVKEEFKKVVNNVM